MLLKKNAYKAKIKNIEDKMPDITNLATKTTLNAKTNEVEWKIPSINSLATTTTVLAAIEHKIPNVRNLFKKTDYNTKITDHSHDKYLTTPEFNKLTAENFAAKLAQTNLVTKTDFDDKLKNPNKNVTSNKIKYVLIENELKELETLDSIYFVVKVILKMMVLKII